MPAPIDSVELFYAHALAIEREATERYSEFQAWFAERGEDVLASLCHGLAKLERDHFDVLAGASAHLDLPPVDAGAWRWLEKGSPEAPVREVFYRVANARQLLEIALQAERNARRFFAWVARTSPDLTVQHLAREMAIEEAEHVRWVQSALEYREPLTGWDELMAQGIGPGTVTTTQ